jgi:formylglycine-generating enzyme required for sulfatase activity
MIMKSGSLSALATLAVSAAACQHATLRHDPIEGLEFAFVPAPQGAKDIWIGRTEVTVRAYTGCTVHGGCSREPLERHATRDGKEVCAGSTAVAEQPLNCVTYDEASAFCTWLRGRLPTAAEWERAALQTGTEALAATVANWTSTGSGAGDRQIRRANWHDAADSNRSWLSGARPADGFGPEVAFRCAQESE